MKINKIVRMFAIVLALSVFGSFAMPDDADAKRFGGGRSIGRTTTVRPSAPAGVTSNQQHFGQQQQRSQINNNAGAAAMNRSGMFGGLFGGLLAGTLLGSLLSGHGFAGGGGLLDIILIGLLIYFGLKFFRNRQRNNNNRQAWSQRSPYENDYTSQTEQQNEISNRSAAAWDNLRSERKDQSSSYSSAGTFNTEEFLAGAKKLYVRMQESWDLRDIEDIKQFTSPIMHKDIEEQFKEDPNPSKTEIILINPSILEVKQEGDYEQVAVLFDVLMKEAENQDNEQVKEIWNFSRNKAKNGTWILDGIQSI